MSHIRKDPVSGHSVIVAEERARRPRRFSLLSEVDSGSFCPFCPGNESSTGETIGSIPEGSGADWSVRAVPNRYPALRVEETPRSEPDGIYDRLSGLGAHEVIIESRNHEKDTATLSVAEVADVLALYRARLRDLKRDVRLKYILAFKNQGAMAGATLPHPHSQILATPTVPTAIKAELANSRRYYDFKSRCLFCDILHQELRDGRRMVYHSGAVAAVAPYASRFPFEIWLLPTEHASHFEDATDELLSHMATALKDVMSRLQVELENPSYNMVLHTGPAQEGAMKHYHWHIEVMPCLQPRAAGFELGSGYFINPTTPEVAADFLRRTDISNLK